MKNIKMAKKLEGLIDRQQTEDDRVLLKMLASKDKDYLEYAFVNLLTKNGLTAELNTDNHGLDFYLPLWKSAGEIKNIVYTENARDLQGKFMNCNIPEKIESIVKSDAWLVFPFIVKGEFEVSIWVHHQSGAAGYINHLLDEGCKKYKCTQDGLKKAIAESSMDKPSPVVRIPHIRDYGPRDFIFFHKPESQLTEEAYKHKGKNSKKAQLWEYIKNHPKKRILYEENYKTSVARDIPRKSLENVSMLHTAQSYAQTTSR